MTRNRTFSCIVIIVIFLACSSTAVFGQDNPVGEKPEKADKYLIDPESFKDDIEKKKNVIILDVRTPKEYGEFHIKGAINVDYKIENFKTSIEKLDKKKKYYVYCRSGKRSANSQKIMNERGFKKVYNLKGGILAWKKEGYMVE